MAKNTNQIARTEITERIASDTEKMQGKLEDLGTAVEDCETVQSTLDGLDLGGTSEGADEIQSAIEGAQGVAIEITDREDTELDAIENEVEQFEGEIQEHVVAVQSDQEKVSDAASKIDRQETSAEVQNAQEAAANDITFLEEQNEQARNAREEVSQQQQDHRSRVKGKGK
ncbi:hypothetical protein ACFL6U_12625 [Planctomycetota bacterium]